MTPQKATKTKWDKESWGDGPWVNEPDEVIWFRPPYSLFVWRHDTAGALNGYVGVLPDNPLFHCDYDELDVEVHGGLTFAGHISYMDANVWWFGFDTQHAWDFAPLLEKRLTEAVAKMDPQPTEFTLGQQPWQHYRDLEFVTMEVEGLYVQLRELAEAIARGERDIPSSVEPE